MQTTAVAPYAMAHFDLDELSPGSFVDYEVVGAGSVAELPASASVATDRRFKLLPVDRPLRVALVSCNDLFHAKLVPGRQSALWARLREQIDGGNVDLVLHAGDQIYADDVHGDPSTDAERMLEDYRSLYVRTWTNGDVASVLSACPSVMMWDDHEIYDGWGSNNNDRTTPLKKRFAVAREAFREFQAAHNPDPLPGSDSFAFAFDINDTGVLVLDGRSNRDYPNNVVLGDAQLRAMERWLSTASAKGLRHLFVLTGVPLVYVPVIGALRFMEAFGGSPESLDDLRDAWTSTKNLVECRRLVLGLLNFAKNSPSTMVTLLSGDVHVGSLGYLESKLHPVNGRPLRIYQVTSSGIARPSPSGTEARLLEMAGTGSTHEILGDDVVARLLPVSGADTRHILCCRNFAVISGSDSNPGEWDTHGNLRVDYYKETDTAHGVKVLPQKLLRPQTD